MDKIFHAAVRDRIFSLVIGRKAAGITQKDISEMTGVSRSNVCNFERGYVNNMYLYDFYMQRFGGFIDVEKKTDC